MSLPHAFKRIRLELARSKEFPAGSANHGYEFVAPLDAEGHIDPVLYDSSRLDDDEAGYRFGAHRFVPGEYVTIRDQEESHTFRIASVQTAT
jgi:hypothetical protein